MYQATFSSASPDLMGIATNLRTAIESTIWTKAVVLIIQSTNWAQNGIA
jgi:hypothetical protein